MMVVPTFNESANIAALVEAFFAALPSGRLLIVDDQSPDGTADICARLALSYPGLRLCRREGPRGLGRAYIAGLSAGLTQGFEAIGTMDADLSHDPRYLPAMLRALESSDIVIGSRYVKDGGTVNWRLRRILLSWLANAFAARLLGIPAHDVTSGFRIYRASALRQVDLHAITSNGYSFLAEMLFRLRRVGASIREVPILFHDRTMGASKLAPREIYVGAYRLLWLRLGGG